MWASDRFWLILRSRGAIQLRIPMAKDKLHRCVTKFFVVDETFIGLIGVIVTIVVYAASMAYWLGGKFKEIESRFREIESKFSEVDNRFREMDRRFDEIKEEIRGVRAEFRRALDDFVTTTRNSQEFILEMLVYEGVRREEAVAVVKSEWRGFSAR